MNEENQNNVNLKNSINFLEMNQSFISSTHINKTECDYLTKVIVVGEQKSGKTSLIHRALDPKNQTEEYEPTVGFEFFNLIVKVKDKKIKMKIWDTCGQEVYRAIVSTFYKGTDLAFLVFSMANRESFLSLKDWLIELKAEINPNAPILLIGTKLDLEEEREVNIDEIHNFMKENNLNSFYFTSIKNDSCSLIFKEAAKQLYSIFQQNKQIKIEECDMIQRYSKIKGKENIILREPPLKENKRKCC